MGKRHASQYANFGCLPFKIFFAKHNLSSFKFSTKVCERDMLVNTPILEAYIYLKELFKKTNFNNVKELNPSLFGGLFD